ncbi:carnitine O-acetyltransferase-like isoform X2 [Venturia canescens]|uniref:carnitine O-acetyltransferase-like isoform X2 n=1 Tax=Venturia canescens TaxID=32260 RepID=UPI001C9D0053|nr:carnitine O-acetyltransferase-like isoform X2 [Venturia canescens]
MVLNVSRSKSTSPGVYSLTSLNLNKQELPKHPVPDLKNTAERYLRSIKPLLNEHEYSRSEKLVTEFVGENGIGQKLHQQLLKRYENTDSWMNEWFLHAAYLGYRDPVIVASSPGTVGPEQHFQTPDDFYTFGAKLVEALWDYDAMVKSGNLKQDMVRNDPLDMQPYAMILGTHRQPGRINDKLIHTDDSKHIIIMSNNHFFKLDICDENKNMLTDGQLKAAIKNVAERSQTAGQPVGILTGNQRDQWAEDYHRLKEIGNNAEILADIEGALFILCLDKNLPKVSFSNKNIASVRAVQCMTGYSSVTNSGNRWHDKTVQYIISPDGFMGMEYEHSPCEGVPVAVLHDHVLIRIEKNSGKIENLADFPKAKHLKFDLDETLEKGIKSASEVVDKISMDIDMECFVFDEFGGSGIKQAKQSPDSFIQVAMQVAFYKVQGIPPAHYESAGLRRFRNTRTECIRSTSVDTVNFAKIMANRNSTQNEKKDAMVRAINTHKRIASEAAIGQGVDRHLFGLKMIAKSENIDLPELYADVGFTRSTHFTLTSSQVPYKTASFMCYGPVVPNGYGCCYNPRPDDILFACSSYKSSKETDTKKFANALQEALNDMKKVAES